MASTRAFLANTGATTFRLGVKCRLKRVIFVQQAVGGVIGTVAFGQGNEGTTLGPLQAISGLVLGDLIAGTTGSITGCGTTVVEVDVPIEKDAVLQVTWADGVTLLVVES